MTTTLPIRDSGQVRQLAAYFLEIGQLRNHALIVLCVNTALRICDLLRLTWDDVYDFENCRFRQSISVSEKKTGKTKILTLNKRAIEALTAYQVDAVEGGVIFISRNGFNKAISRQQAYRIIKAGAEALAFAFRVSCHSLRKTFGYLAFKAGVPAVVIMKVYNHSSLAITLRYIGITQDDIDHCYHKLAELT